MKNHLIFLLLFCSGCSFYAQVYKTKSDPGLKISDEGYVFENDTVQIKYDFWSEHGVLEFTIFNKLSVPIYIDWRKSAMVRNDIKLDYYIDEETTVASSNYSSFLYANWYGVSGLGKSKSTSVKTKPERISFIAPKSIIKRNQFVLFPSNFTKFKGEEKTTISTKDSTKKTTLSVQKMTKENTILKFRNFLTLSTTEKFNSEFYIDNGFYVSQIMQMKQEQFDGPYNITLQNWDYPFSDSRWFYTQQINGDDLK